MHEKVKNMCDNIKNKIKILRKIKNGEPFVQISGGIAVGPCYAGVIGKEDSKVSYTVWGKVGW